MRTIKLTNETRKDILTNLLKRSPANYGAYETAVAEIVGNVREKGDEAVLAYTKQFDKFDLTKENMQVTKAEIEEAYAMMDKGLLDVYRRSAENIRVFHEKQLRTSWFDSKPDGTILGQRMIPIARAGVYVPGGKAAYPSSVLMNVIPAKVAGVEEIIMTTPATVKER